MSTNTIKQTRNHVSVTPLLKIQTEKGQKKRFLRELEGKLKSSGLSTDSDISCLPCNAYNKSLPSKSSINQCHSRLCKYIFPLLVKLLLHTSAMALPFHHPPAQIIDNIFFNSKISQNPQAPHISKLLEHVVVAQLVDTELGCH